LCGTLAQNASDLANAVHGSRVPAKPLPAPVHSSIEQRLASIEQRLAFIEQQLAGAGTSGM
jgi:hypothetical protein